MTDRPTPLDPPPNDEGEPSAESVASPGPDSPPPDTEPEDTPADEPRSEVADDDTAAAPADGGARYRAALTAVAARGRRRPLLVAVAAVVSVALIVTLVVATGGEDRAVPAGEIPTLDNQFARPSGADPTTSAEPAEPAGLPAYSGGPLWTFPHPAGTSPDETPTIAVTDPGYLIQQDETVIGLDKAGNEMWRFSAPDNNHSLDARTNGPLVFVSYGNPDDDRWPQPLVILALDAATGAERWRETEASFWSLTTDTIYLSVCYGGQNNRIGDCQLSARDPRGNAVRWRVPVYASSGVVNSSDSLQAEPTPPYLLVESHPTGGTETITSHDPDTGARLGTGFIGPDEDVDSLNSGADRTVVEMDDNDENPADGCTATLTGYAVSGADQTWQYTARTAKEDDGRRCGYLPYSTNNGRVGVTSESGVPSVLNAATGAVEWSAPTQGTAVAASDTVLLAVESTEDTDDAEDPEAELVAYQVGNATPLWRARFVGTAGSSRVTITATTAVVLSDDEAVGYDLASGTGWSYGSGVALETAGVFVLCGAGYCRGFGTA